MKKFALIILAVVFVVTGCNLDSLEGQELKDMFFMEYVYAGNIDSYMNDYGTEMMPDEGNIFWEITLKVTNLTNEKQYIGGMSSTERLHLANNHEYGSSNSYIGASMYTIMPQQTKEISFIFETLKNETPAGGLLKFNISMTFEYNSDYEVTIPLTLVSPLTNEEVKNNLLGCWKLYAGTDENFAGFIVFNNDNSCFKIGTDGVKIASSYSVSEDSISFSNPSLNKLSIKYTVLKDRTFNTFNELQQNTLYEKYWNDGRIEIIDLPEGKPAELKGIWAGASNSSFAIALMDDNISIKVSPTLIVEFEDWNYSNYFLSFSGEAGDMLSSVAFLVKDLKTNNIFFIFRGVDYYQSYKETRTRKDVLYEIPSNRMD